MPELDTPVPATDTPAPDAGVDFENTAIPETFKDSPVGKYKTVGELAKGYTEAQKLIGAKGVILPGEKATPEEVEKFYNTLGRPEKPDGYKLSPLEKLHPELKITPESEAGFKALVHKHGLTAKQADGLYKEYFGMISQSLTKRDEGMLASKHEAEKALRTDWGANYDKNLAGAKRLIDKFGGEGGREGFGDIGNNPKVLKTLANIAKQFSEDGFIKGNDVKSSEVADAQKQLTAILLNKDHPYWKAGAGHAEAVAEYARLQAIVTPNEREATLQV